jgi:hypothetical protein
MDNGVNLLKILFFLFLALMTYLLIPAVEGMTSAPIVTASWSNGLWSKQSAPLDAPLSGGLCEERLQ